MQKRIIVLLKINNTRYKFLSIFKSKVDSSFYIYQHIKDEKSPINIAEPIHLLKSNGNIDIARLEKKLERNGDRIHLAIHPKRIYLKRLNLDGDKEHLIEEHETQPFKNSFRLHAIFTAPPISHMNMYSKNKNVNIIEVVFSWNKLLCPQISVYEIEKNFPVKQISNLLPPGDEIITIPADGLHNTIGLQLRSTNGEPGVWRPNCGIFGKIVKKKPISKKELQNIIKYNNLSFDISSIPDEASITDYKINY